MRKFLTHSLRYYCYLFAMIVIVVAILLQSVRLLAPNINSARPSIEKFLSSEINAKVHLGKIHASWYGLRPHVLVDDVLIADVDGNKLLSIEKSDLTLDILNSVLNFQWVWKRVAFDNIYLDIREGENGRWEAAGFPVSANNQSSWRYHSPIKLFEVTPRVDLNNANLQFTFLNKKVLHTKIPAIKIENDNGFHRLIASANIQGKEAFSLVLEKKKGDDQKSYSSAFLKLSQFPVEDVVDAFVSNNTLSLNNDGIEPSLLAKQSSIDASVWFDFSGEGSFSFLGDFLLTGISETELAKKHFLNIPVAANLQGSFDRSQGWSIGVGDVTVDGSQSIKQALIQQKPDSLQLAIDKITIQSWVSWLKSKLLVPKEAMETIELISTQGDIENILVSIDSEDIKKSIFSANVVNLSSKPFDNIPGVENVSGYIESDFHRGAISIDTKNLHLLPHQVYEKSLVFDDINGQIAWSIEPEKNRIIVNSNNIVSASAFGLASGYFYLDVPWETDSRKADFYLQVGLKNSSVNYYEQFIPKRVPEALTTWLSNSVRKGEVEQAGFIYRGSFSGDSNTRSYQLFFDMSQADLAYSPDWPMLENIRGQVLLDNQYVYAKTNQASVYGEPLDNLKVIWLGDSHKELNVQVRGKLLAASGLRLLNESWLNTKVDNTFKNWSATGDIQMDVDVNIPLFVSDKVNQSPPKQRVNVRFLNNRMSLNDQDLRLASVNGHLLYSEVKGLHADKINMQLFDQPLSLTINQQRSVDPLTNDEYLSIKGSSSVDVGQLADWLRFPEMELLEGMVAYQAELQIPLVKPSASHRAKLTIASDLKGMVSHFPAPFSKEKQQKRGFTINSLIYSDQVKHVISFGQGIKSEVLVKEGGVSGYLLANRERLQQTNEPSDVFSIQADVDQVSADEWLDTFSIIQNARAKQEKEESSTNKKANPSIVYDMNIGELLVKDTPINDIQIVGKKAGNLWRSLIKNNDIEGNVIFDDSFSEPIQVTLNYLNIPSADKDQLALDDNVDPLQNMDVSLIKPASVAIKKLVYKGADLGDWRFNLQPVESGIHIDDIYANFSGMALRGESADTGASLHWSTTRDDTKIGSTNFSGKLLGGDIQRLFKDWGYPVLVESKETELNADISWLGSPAFFSMNRVGGSLKLEMKDGLFVQSKAQASTGVLRLLGLFNFNTWTRRLKLDFSDLYKKGVVYDRVTGRFSFNKGWIYLQEPLRVQSPSSEFTMAGTINYPNENVDMVLVTTLPVGGNLTLAAGLVAGLPIAAGVYIVSKVFKKQVDKVASLTYAIKGGWNDPDITFINLFSNKLYYENKPSEPVTEVDDNL